MHPNKRAAIFLLTAACSLVFSQNSFAQNNNVLTVASDAPAVKAKVGSTVEAKLPLQLRPGYHTNSNTPSDPYLIGLKLTWNPGPLESTGITYPKPSMEKYAFSEKPLSVFSGNFDLTTKFKVPSTAIPGPSAVTGKLRYQACNDSMCLPPKTIDVTLQVDIVR